MPRPLAQFDKRALFDLVTHLSIFLFVTQHRPQAFNKIFIAIRLMEGDKAKALNLALLLRPLFDLLKHYPHLLHIVVI